MGEFEINTPLRVAGFMPQVGHESGSFQFMEEIASGAAYDNRADLGNTNPIAIAIAAAHGTTPGRFWKGHGPLQVTGYWNHLLMMMELGIDCVENPKLLTEPLNGCRAAGHFWKTNNLNRYADIGDIDGMSDLVNKGRKTAKYGDANGFAERAEMYKKWLKVLT